MYMPGHAGHLLARLFGLSPEVMPLLEKQTLQRLIRIRGIVPADLDRVRLYKFSGVKNKFDSWQNFHREFADYKDLELFKQLEIRSKFTTVVFPMHPFEFHFDFESVDNYECFYVDLDLQQWGGWVSREQEKLGFVVRPDEQYYFEKHKKLHNMKPINLTAMLSSDNAFMEEYIKISNSMGVTPMLSNAQILFDDWKSVRL